MQYCKIDNIDYSNVGSKNKIFIGNGNIKNFSLNINGNNNTIIILGDVNIKEVKIELSGNNNKLIISNKLRVNGVLNLKFVRADDCSVFIDHDVVISRHLNIYCFIGGPGSVPDNSLCYIGKNTLINGDTTIFLGERNSNVIIGNDCLFASNIKIKTTDNHAIFDAKTFKRLNPAGNIFIGSHCWICDNVTFLNNSSIGSNCVVGTECIVTKKFTEDNILVVGLPGKIVRRDINWSRYLGDEKDDYTDVVQANEFDSLHLDVDGVNAMIISTIEVYSDRTILLGETWNI